MVLLFFVLIISCSYTCYASCVPYKCEMSGEFPMDCPLHDSLLRVHYRGILLDESKSVFYDTQVDNDGEPLEFCSGEGLVNNITLTFVHAIQ